MNEAAGVVHQRPMTDPYSAIEAQTGFRVPELFRRLVADGRTQYGATREEWKQTWKQRMLADPPALMLVSSQVEWWTPEAIAEWEPPDYWSAEHRFVPFAQNGAGDVWCWHVSSPDAEIVFAPHDENEAEVVAPDLAAFLFRQLVGGLSEIYPDDGTDFSIEQRVASAKANVRTLAPYLPAAQVALLEQLCERPLVEDPSWGCLRFLSRAEADAIIEREIGYPRLGHTFEHMT